MQIDFSQIQQKLIEKLQSETAENIPSPNEVDAQQSNQFKDAMSFGSNNVDNANAASQKHPSDEVASLTDVSQTLSPGDRILGHLAEMSERTRQIQKVAAGSATTGGDVGSALHAQVEMANIASATGTATDAANKSSQSAETLLKSS